MSANTDDITAQRIDNLREWRANATPEEIHNASMKGVEARRKNKAMRDVAQFILNAELLDDDEIGQQLDAIGAERTWQDAILYNIAKKARDFADVEAARFLRDTSGQKPTENMAFGNLDGDALKLSLGSLTDAQLLELIEKRTE